jgi:hypothetical protein
MGLPKLIKIGSGLVVLVIAFVVIASLVSDKTNSRIRGSGEVFPDGFQLAFPTPPTRFQMNSPLEGFGDMRITTYKTVHEDATYFLSIKDFADERLNEKNPDFDPQALISESLREMINDNSNMKLLGQTETSIQRHAALRYRLQLGREIADGLMVYRGTRIYLVAVDYSLDHPMSNSQVEAFIGSLAFQD